MINSLAGGHLSGDEMLVVGLVAAAVALVACLFVPRKVSGLLPAFLFRSRLWNSLILAGLVLCWLIPVGVIVFVFRGRPGSTGGDTGEGLALAIVLAATYLILLGAGSLAGAAWGWLGLRSGVEGACRKLNIAQIVAAVPAGLMGVAALTFMASQN